MKFTNRFKGIEGITNAYWDSPRNRLVIYYRGPLDTAKIKVAGVINDASLHNAVEEITFISLEPQDV